MKKNWALFWVSGAITLLLVVGIGELILRVRYGAGSLPKEIAGGYPPHLVMPNGTMRYTLTPGFIGNQIVQGSSDVELKINRQGLRDHEREFPHAAEFIISVGDSFTFGHGVPFEETWLTLLENKIRAQAPQYDVVKAGVPGFGWRQYYWQYKRLAQDLNHHPLVIVGFTVDAGDRTKVGYEVKGGILVKRFYPNLAVLDGLVYEKASRSEWINRMDAFLRTHSYFFRWFNQRLVSVYHRSKKAILQWVERRGEKPRSRSPEMEKETRPIPPLSEQEHIREALSVFDSIEELAKTKQAKMLVLFISLPRIWDHEIEYCQKVLSEKGIPNLDLSKYETPEWHFAQDAHWNAFGSQQVAERVYEFIQEEGLLKTS